MISERVDYARKAIEAADALQQWQDKAILHIDALGWMLIQLDRLDEAEMSIQSGLFIAECLEENSEYRNDLIALGYTFLAMLYLNRQNTERAERYIEQARSHRSQTIIQRRLLQAEGDLALQQKNHSAAIQHYQNARLLEIEYSPKGRGYSEWGYALGFVYLFQGELTQAEAEFAKHPNSPRMRWMDFAKSRYGLACVAKAKGEYDTARYWATDALDRISKLRVNHRLMRDITALLEELDSLEAQMAASAE
jgi:LuxR family glucitol operon transcriptional activator